MKINCDILEVPAKIVCDAVDSQIINASVIINKSGESIIQVKVIYNHEEMSPYLYNESLVCYLGNDTITYKHGTFWEKVEEDSNIYLRQLNIYIDLSNYLSLDGGTLSGDLTTTNIYPSSTGSYNIGYAGRPYKKIYCNSITTDTLRAYNEVNVEELTASDIYVLKTKVEVDNNDSLVIYNQKGISNSEIKFLNDDNKFLNSSGEFVYLKQVIMTSDDMNITDPKVGLIVQYIGETNYFYNKYQLYIYNFLKDKLKITFQNLPVSEYKFNGEFNYNRLYLENILLYNISNTISHDYQKSLIDFLKDEQQSVEIVYSIGSINNKWDLFINGFIHDSYVLDGNPIDIINTLVTNNDIYQIEQTTITDSVRLTISSCGFEPLFKLDYPNSREKFLNGVGEWVSLNNNNIQVSLTHNVSQYNDFTINGLDSIIESGFYLLYNEFSMYVGILCVSKINENYITQQVTINNNIYNDVNLDYMYREGYQNAWTDWSYVYLNTQKKSVSIKKAGYYTPTCANWENLFSTSLLGETIVYLATIDGVKGFLLTKDTSLQSLLTAPTSEDFGVNILDKSYFNTPTMSGNLTHFFPLNFYRYGSNVKNVIDIIDPTHQLNITGGCIYYAKDGVILLYYDETAHQKVFHVENNFLTYGKQNGFAVRLIDYETDEFTHGNLQYNIFSEKFRIALEPNTVIGKSQQITNGWIDLFGYGMSGYQNTHPNNRSIDPADYDVDMLENSNYDWGKYNNVYKIKTETSNDIFK